jgi:hypothetical protein
MATVCPSIFAAPEARANGRMPAGHQLVVSPIDPNTLVLETTFGLLFSHDQGATFGWVCESPIGYGDGGVQDPSIGITSRFVLGGVREGVSISPDQGCSWTFPVRDAVVDLVVRPDDPHTALALTSTFSGVGDAGQNVYTTRVLVTHDDGATWAQQGVPIDPAVQVETIEVARSDPGRIYIGGVSHEPGVEGGSDRVAVVLASTNAGTSYALTAIPLASPFETTQGAAYVSAVDPSNAQRVYVRIGDYVVDRLLVSDDGAMTFRTVFQAKGPLLGFALSNDGSKVYVGGPTDGVQLAPGFAGDAGAPLQFAQRSTASVSCLTWSAGTLYACMGEPQNRYLQQLGASSDDGRSFAPRFLFACMDGPLACPGGAVAAQCAPGLPLLQAAIGLCPEGGADASDDASSPAPEGGEPDGASPDDAGRGGAHPPTKSASCGCSAGDARAGGMSLAAMGGAVLLLRRRRSLRR